MITSNILVTVITVTYNSAKYVRDAIEGVLAQTHKNIQYIIADDCSTDDTWNIINEYKDDRIIAYRNETNLREYPNRNKAISMAKGEYLIFIDGDDVIFPTAIEYLLYYANQFSDAALLIQKNYHNNILFPVLLTPKQTFTNIYFGKKNLINSSFTANFFKTKILQNLGGLSDKYLSGDDDIRLRIGIQHNVLLIQGWVSWPRETPNQASSKIGIVKSYSESYSMLQDLKANENITAEMICDAKNFKRKQIANTILYLLKKLKVSQANTLMSSFDISLFQVFKLKKYIPKLRDSFDDFSPASPYKQEFQNICNSK